MVTRSSTRGKREPWESAMEMYSQVASSATKVVAITTSRKEPFSRSSRTRGMSTAAVMTRFMISKRIHGRSLCRG
jgi:hypothetical protein